MREALAATNTSTEREGVLPILVDLLQNQANRLAQQAAEIQQLRAEAEILKWRCNEQNARQEKQVDNAETATAAPLAEKDGDRLSSATDFLADLKIRYQRFALEEEALQKELKIVSTREDLSVPR